jgi:ADP-ribose pyrophosphatase
MTLHRWKKIGESRTLLSTERLTVYEDVIEIPDGTRGTYIHFGAKKIMSSVGIIAIRNDGKILLQKELSYPLNEFLWQWPGGGAYDTETLEEAANRELMEEANLRAGSIELLGKVHLNNRRLAGHQCVVIARDLHEESMPADIGEAFEDHWFSEAEIDALVADGAITNSTCLAGWALYKSKK